MSTCTISVECVTFNKECICLDVCKSERIIATVCPENATNKSLCWCSTNPSVATVDDNGNVTALSVGTATITAMSADGSNRFDTCTVTVNEVKVTSVTIDSDYDEVTAGENFFLHATVCPTNATDKSVTWSSSNPTVATVNSESGLVYAHNAGSTVITVTACDCSGCSDSITLCVQEAPIKVSYIELDKSVMYLEKGSTGNLTATVCPTNAADKSVTWMSCDNCVATVDADGKVTAVNQGTTTIKATAKDGSGKYATCIVHVTGDVLVTSVSVTPSSKTINKEESFYVHETVCPDEATDKCVSWSSSNSAVASVNQDGFVYAHNAGTATITATACDGSGKKGHCYVTVNDLIRVERIEVSPTSVILKEGDSYNITATVYPENATNKTVTWSSSGPDIVMVNSNTGDIYAVKSGAVMITATSDDGGFESSCVVLVEEDEGVEEVTPKYFEEGKIYRFINMADTNGRALNAYSDSTPSSLTNICLYTSNKNDDCQKWLYVKEGTHDYFVCKANPSLALDQYTGTSGGSGVNNYNAHLYEPSETSYVIPEYARDSDGSIVSVKLQLECDPTKFLTANENANGTSSGKSVNSNGNVYWYQSAGVTQYSQDWLVEEVDEVKPNPDVGGDVFENGKTYRLLNRGDSKNRAMKSLSSYVPKSLDNICLSVRNRDDDCQKWVFKGTASQGYFECYANRDLTLDLFTGSQENNGNAHLYALTSTSYFTSDYDQSTNTFTFKNNSTNKYLTANNDPDDEFSGNTENSNGNVYWHQTKGNKNWFLERIGTIKPNVDLMQESGNGEEPEQYNIESLEDGGIYLIVNKEGNSERTIRVDAEYIPTSLCNVCLGRNTETEPLQKWKYVGTTSGGYLINKKNESFALSKVVGYNACLSDISTASEILVESVSNDGENAIVRIKLKNESKYLTANVDSSGTKNGIYENSPGNIYWAEELTEYKSRQEWIVEEVTNYAIYPCRYMKITQDAFDLTYSTSHGYYSDPEADFQDYPVDEACIDSDKSYMYCPCDEMEIMRIYGVGKSGTNTIWLRSTTPVDMPCGTDYLVMMVMHPDDDTLEGIVIGQKFTRGEPMFEEGNDQPSTGNHFHISVGKGELVGNGWKENSNDMWVLNTTGGAIEIQDAFYLDLDFTQVIDNKGINFVQVPNN